ncbi:MAG: MBL fold metallo-hydrolase [Clostridia bacterium]
MNNLSGQSNYVTSQNPEIKVIAHRLAVELLKTGANDKSRGGGYVNKRVRLLAGVNKLIRPEWSLTFPPYFMRTEDIIIGDDDDKILRVIGIQGKIIYTPGHSIDSISILLDNGILFAGDAAANYLNFSGTRYSPVFITDAKEYYMSWEKMIAAGAKTIYPTHGKPFSVDKLKQNICKIKNENPVKFF